MAKKNEDFGMEELIRGLTSLRKDVRDIKANTLLASKQVYTNQETMDILGVASATLKMWRDNGIIGYSQVGKIYLYSKSDIDKFLKDNHFDTFSNKRQFVSAVNSELNR